MDGLTLLELMLTVGIVAVLIAVAAPAFRDIVLDSRRSTTLNALVRTLHLARAESLRTGLDVVVCPTGDTSSCNGNAGTWGQGWLAFINSDGDQPAVRDPDETVLATHALANRARMRSNRAAFYYRPFNRRSTNGTLVYCDDRGANSARALIVSYTGRPRVSRRDAGGRQLSCGE